MWQGGFLSLTPTPVDLAVRNRVTISRQMGTTLSWWGTNGDMKGASNWASLGNSDVTGWAFHYISASVLLTWGKNPILSGHKGWWQNQIVHILTKPWRIRRSPVSGAMMIQRADAIVENLLFLSPAKWYPLVDGIQCAPDPTGQVEDTEQTCCQCSK